MDGAAKKRKEEWGEAKRDRGGHQQHGTKDWHKELPLEVEEEKIY
jgi:hypothetical protein